jgi:hypothetical protein
MVGKGLAKQQRLHKRPAAGFAFEGNFVCGSAGLRPELFFLEHQFSLRKHSTLEH